MLSLGLEPKTFRMSGRCNNQYTTKYMHIVKEQRSECKKHCWFQDMAHPTTTFACQPLTVIS